jgi:hypothetical protein
MMKGNFKPRTFSKTRNVTPVKRTAENSRNARFPPSWVAINPLFQVGPFALMEKPATERSTPTATSTNEDPFLRES